MNHLSQCPCRATSLVWKFKLKHVASYISLASGFHNLSRIRDAWIKGWQKEDVYFMASYSGVWSFECSWICNCNWSHMTSILIPLWENKNNYFLLWYCEHMTKFLSRTSIMQGWRHAATYVTVQLLMLSI